MYTISLVFPDTEEGKELLEDKYAEVLAKITIDMLNKEELKILIDRLENK